MHDRKTNITKLSECKREIEVELPAEEVSEEFDSLITRYAQKAKIHGFRPGKAPKNMVKQMYQQEIQENLIHSLAPKALTDVLKTQEIQAASVPVITDIKFQEGEPLRFKASFEVWPDFMLPDYKKFKFEKKTNTVAAKELEQALKDIQQRSVQYILVEERGVKEGDYVVAKIKGKDKKSKRFLPSEKAVVVAGHPENDKTLNQNLTGLKPEEETNFSIDYNKDHPNKKLAGKEIEYNLKILSIKEKKFPDINDDFAKDLGDYKNLKELKDKLKKEILLSKEKMAKNELADEILKIIADKLSFEIPEKLVEQEYISVFREALSSHPNKKNLKQEDIEAMKEQAKKKAEQNVKYHLIIKKIAEAENIQVSEEELQKEMKAIASANNISLTEVVNHFRSEGKSEDLRENLLLKKTVDFLANNAIIK